MAVSIKNGSPDELGFAAAGSRSSACHSTVLAGLHRALRQVARAWRSHCFEPRDEQAFKAFYAERTYVQARFGMALGFVAWCGFSFWDVLAFPGLWGRLIAVRLLFVAPILGWLWWLVARWPARFKARMALYLAIAPTAASVGLLLMMALTQHAEPVRSFELLWPAFAAVYLFQYAFLGLTFVPAATLGACSLAIVGLFGIASDGVPRVVDGAFLELAILNVLGMIICARNEIHQRMLFRLRQRFRRQVSVARQQRENARQARDRALAESRRAEAAAAQVEVERVKVEAFTRTKERFFSAAYHDLQQPLSIIGLYARLAANKLGNGPSPSVRADLAVIEGASQDIAMMFKEVRDLWEIGRAEPVLAVLDLNSLLSEIDNELRGRAERKGLCLRLRKPLPTSCFVRSDRALLKRAISNLVSNAIKYTERGGIVLGTRIRGASVRIIVRDTGVGIPEAFHERIFDEYFRVDDAARGDQRGLGLGLSIVNRITTALPNHQLGFWSQPGRGSRFSLAMPIAGGAPTECCQPGPRSPVSGGEALAGKYVFVVEDERLILDALIAALHAAGCVVEGVGCVDTARALLATRDRCPDVLVTDYRLPHGNTGLDVVAAMRDRFEWATETPIVLVTGDLHRPVPPEGFGGRWQIIRKPIDLDLLVRQLGELVSRPYH